jgi:hypothetical protein
MEFQEKQKEIINLRKEIEEKINALEEKQREVTKMLSLGMSYTDNKQDKKYAIESIKTKEGIFPYRQLYISDANGVGLLPIERVNLLNEEGIRTWSQ